MKRIIILFAAALLLAVPAIALTVAPVAAQQLDRALAAYEAGDYAAAFGLLQPLAEEGDLHAQHQLGIMYYLGRGVAADPERAALWTRRAAEQGYVKAQNNYAYLLFWGEGVEKDRPEAVRWYVRAAEQGDVPSANTLGTLFRFGHGVPKNDAEAAKWFSRAAAQGHVEAQLYLGVMYERGEGVKQDRVHAQTLYLLAAAAGDSEAAKNRDFNARNLTGAQNAEAERLAGELQQLQPR